MTDRMQPPEGSEPEGPGFGKPWVPQVGVTFMASGALVRSLIDMTAGQEGNGLVAMDVAGKWNHAAADTLSIITHPDVAEEWGHYLIDCAAAARKDQKDAQGHLPQIAQSLGHKPGCHCRYPGTVECR